MKNIKLKKKESFNKAAFIFIYKKNKAVINLINKYLRKDSIENLHYLRIGIRRLRYSMELFYSFFDYKLVMNIYNTAKYLQDLVGAGRDLDVIKLKLEKYQEENNINIPITLFEKIESDIKYHRKNIKRELRKFLNSKDIKKLLLKNIEVKNET
ncbi:MAG: CHAD domain-containing protein [Ignavibacteriales bacterium]|nr:CHAD domain-containing protein [Ignavibacteriales bacterium]